MITTCVGCGKVLARYLPLDEERSELCRECMTRQQVAESRQLTCGLAECVYLEVPYECLLSAAQGEAATCPGLRRSGIS